jgi:hypothetical protein
MRAFLPQKQREIRLNSKRDSAAKSAFAALWSVQEMAAMKEEVCFSFLVWKFVTRQGTFWNCSGSEGVKIWVSLLLFPIFLSCVSIRVARIRWSEFWLGNPSFCVMFFLFQTFGIQYS